MTFVWSAIGLEKHNFSWLLGDRHLVVKGLDSYGPRLDSAGLKSTSGIAIIKCYNFLEMALHADQNGQIILDKSCVLQVENPIRKFSSK